MSRVLLVKCDIAIEDKAKEGGHSCPPSTGNKGGKNAPTPLKLYGQETIANPMWNQSWFTGADNLRANSRLTSSDYFMPVPGIIFLRHGGNCFDAA